VYNLPNEVKDAVWWCVAWQWNRQPWEVDFAERADAESFALHLAESGREEVGVIQLAAPALDDESRDRIWTRIVHRLEGEAAEAKARGVIRVSELESRLRLYEGTRPPKGAA